MLSFGDEVKFAAKTSLSGSTNVVVSGAPILGTLLANVCNREDDEVR
jgi:hypothetical protein